MNPEWVEAGAQALVGGTNYVMSGDNGVAGTMNRLTAEFVIRAVEPLIRADERGRFRESMELAEAEVATLKRIMRGWPEMAHAEAVAARLVEVICEMDRNARKDANAIFRLAQRDINATIQENDLRAELMDLSQRHLSLRAQIAADIEVESAKASVRELSDPNAYARRVAYDNAARIARNGGAQ